MVYDEIDNPKPLSKRGARKCAAVLAVFVFCYVIAVMMTADRPAHATDCQADTITCAMETDQ